MTKWTKAFTYIPKIKSVQTGTCRQTIRPGHTVRVGDEILFHGWTGKPYRSKWSWRLRVKVNEVEYVLAFREGLVYLEPAKHIHWKDLDDLAEADGIDPPTGEELKHVLTRMSNIKLQSAVDGTGVELQIIRWDWPPLAIGDYQLEA